MRSSGSVALALWLLAACGGSHPTQDSDGETAPPAARSEPPAEKDSLELHGRSGADGLAIAEALPLDERPRWSGPDQQLPVVAGEMDTIPADAILLELAPNELRIGGARVLPLVGGRWQKGEATTASLRDALLAERETFPDDAAVTLAIAADASIPSSSLIRIAELLDEAGIASVGWVGRSALVEHGFVRFSSPSRRTLGSSTLRIDAKGFHLTGPSGDTQDIAAPYDFEALHHKALALAEGHSNPPSLFVSVAPDIPASVLVNAFARTRDLDVRLQDERPKEVDAPARHAAILGVLSAEGGSGTVHRLFAQGAVEDAWIEDMPHSGLEEALTEAAKPGSSATKGSLDSDAIRRVVGAKAGEIRACYEKALRKRPGLAGKVVLAFTVGADGTVSSSSVESTTLKDKDVGTCIAAEAKGWTFPAPRGGETATVQFPFLFESV